MKLIEPTIEYKKQIEEYRREFLEAGGSMDGCGSLRRFEDARDWLAQVEAFKHPETVPDGLVTSTQFVYVREEDEKIVGMIQIRHYLNDYLRDYAGHIGYSVCPGERRRGYATQMLRETLPYCRELGIDNVMISCLNDNEASRRVILKCGGVYDSTVYEADRDRYLERYIIDLTKDINKAELWDAYDRDLNKIDGATLVRGERIPEGIYHLVAEVIVRHTDGEYLLMQRDPRKHYGGMWEATAGGSAIKGETPYECAVRELREETGISSEGLVEVGRAVSHDTVYVEFLCVTSCDKDSVTLQAGETSAYKWVTKEELLSMKCDELVTKRMQGFIKDLQGEV